MDIVTARIVHVLSIVLWIGGVGFVTTVLFPAVRRSTTPEKRLAAFLTFESQFAWQARISVALTGLSGLYMTWRAGRLGAIRYGAVLVDARHGLFVARLCRDDA